MAKIVAKREIVPNVHMMEIAAPELAAKMRAGQFVIIMADELAERLPFSVSDWDAKAGTITVVFLEAGWSTRKMVDLRAGDELAHVVGPLGRPSEIVKGARAVCAGGCYGVGAVLPLSRALKAAGSRVTTIIEARSDYLLYWKDRIEPHCDELLIATSDGSAGVRGHVYDVIQTMIEQGRAIDRVYAIGCTFMMKRCADVTRPSGIKTMVALNPIMVDGTGMCGCCRVSVGGKTKFACVDGPEFDGHEVDWQELSRRRAMYPVAEVESFDQGEYVHHPHHDADVSV